MNTNALPRFKDIAIPKENSRLGTGGFAVVHFARQKVLGDVAVKVLVTTGAPNSRTQSWRKLVHFDRSM